MEHIQKDDIIIRKGILHILDSHTGYLGLSSQLLEMGPDLMEFVRGHIFKIMESDDAKRCQFNGSVSPVLSLLESMEESDDESFIEATRVLGENLFDIMCDSVTIPAADLLCVTFQVQSVIHIALLKMNYKVTYVHREEEDAEANDIVKQRVMPTDSAKLTEAVIIDLSEYKTRKLYIDSMLIDAGWTEGKDWINEVELSGMPNKSEVGFADYVLYDDMLDVSTITEKLKKYVHTFKKVDEHYKWFSVEPVE